MAEETITINPATMQEVGDNLKATKQGNLLILVVDTTVEIGESSSGKMMGNASTGGFASLPGNRKANVYIGRKL